jgi:hypothetical protein
MWEDGAVGSGAWQLFDTASEETFRNHEAGGVLRFRIEIRGQAYRVDLSQCTQQNVRTGFVRNLKRRAAAASTLGKLDVATAAAGSCE